MVPPALEGLLPDDISEETVTVSKKKLEALLKELRDLTQQVELLRQAQLAGASRLPPPPAWVKANVPRDEAPKKRGAKEGHEAHHRPPPSRIDEEQEVELPSCPKCGEDLGDPFEVDERTVESIVPGHVRVTTYRIGRYRCRHCNRVRRARLPPEVAPPRSPFSWSTHFLVGYWSMKGLTNSLIREFLATDYGLKVSQGVVDNMLRRAAELFAPAYEAIRQALKEGRQVNVDWTGWRVDGINHHLWDFVSPDARAAYFTVARSAGHTVPEGVLGKRRPKGQVLNCDGGTAFNAMGGKIQRCWVHILRKAVQAQDGWERPSDAPDWRGLRAMEKLSRRILEVAKWPQGEAKAAEARRLKAWARRWIKVGRGGQEALALRKFLAKRWEELWWWAEVGVDAHNNVAEQGLRPHIAVKRKLSWGSRTNRGAGRTAVLASVIQTGKMQGIPFRELGSRVLHDRENPFHFGPGPPAPG